MPPAERWIHTSPLVLATTSWESSLQFEHVQYTAGIGRLSCLSATVPASACYITDPSAPSNVAPDLELALGVPVRGKGLERGWRRNGGRGFSGRLFRLITVSLLLLPALVVILSTLTSKR